MEPKVFHENDKVRYTLEQKEYMEERNLDVPDEGTVIYQGNFGMTYILWDGKTIKDIEAVPAKHLITVDKKKPNRNANKDFEVFVNLPFINKVILTGTHEECATYCKKRKYKINIKDNEYVLDIRKAVAEEV